MALNKEMVRSLIRTVIRKCRHLARHDWLSRFFNLFYSEVQLSTVSMVGKGCFIGRGSQVINGQFITIGDRVGFGAYSRIEVVPTLVQSRPNLIIEEGVSTGWFTHIACAQRVHIRKDTLIASNVYITDHNHGFNDRRTFRIRPADTGLESSPVVIGERCWIGEQVCILPGVTIGADCLVGAGSVVTKDIPEGHMAVGVPARVIKKRCTDTGQWVNLSPTGEKAIG